jgi:GntR family transcriptional regulator
MTASESGPVYLRLRAILAGAILAGDYAEGAQLPSVRAFAAAHGANPLTVAKAYQTLQDEGHVVVRRGVGMFVAAHAARRLREQERDAFLTQTWPVVRAQIDRLGLDVGELIADHSNSFMQTPA